MAILSSLLFLSLSLSLSLSCDLRKLLMYVAMEGVTPLPNVTDQTLTTVAIPLCMDVATTQSVCVLTDTLRQMESGILDIRNSEIIYQAFGVGQMDVLAGPCLQPPTRSSPES